MGMQLIFFLVNLLNCNCLCAYIPSKTGLMDTKIKFYSNSMGQKLCKYAPLCSDISAHDPAWLQRPVLLINALAEFFSR